ncbi:MAG: type I DNA topoisomerase [Vampirovibrionales bacterium]|nr:type I DNA topoisomerase [Vampirovibrionales bacterium]
MAPASKKTTTAKTAKSTTKSKAATAAAKKSAATKAAKPAAKPKASAKAKAPTKTRAKKETPKIELEDLSNIEDGTGSGRSLVIVESPAKAKTLKKILGPKFSIKASVGHIRDLPEKKLGVDVDNDFEPDYEVLSNKLDVVNDLRIAARKSDTVYLASDPDREGEAIAWHISSLLDKPKDKMLRIEFNEITKKAILEAIEKPRQIDIQRVNAQQTRRILDRLVGYKLSPLLWKKVTKGLSAGRVQSVTVRLICEREEQVVAFVPEEYWSVRAELKNPQAQNATFETNLVKINGEKVALGNEAETMKIVDTLENNPYEVSALNTRESRRKPVAPFITSTLQRDASTRLGYPVKKTMQVAQKLYEGIDLGAEGPVGLITYMRTDSTRISDEARDAAKDFIFEKYGKEYYPETPNTYEKKGKKNVQDAHEAIRPSYVEKTPESVKEYLKDDQFRLYSLIWERFMASQMSPAVIKTKSVEFTCDNCTLRATHSTVTFKGYMAVYDTSVEEEEDASEENSAGAIPELNKGDKLSHKAVHPKQHFTEPPPRFNEASLVKTLEELGIGRPSTYAPTIATVQDRGYVFKEEKVLKPTELGKAVNKLLVEHFNSIVDVNFTANLENRLDEIAEDSISWRGVIRDFYEPFDATLKKATNEMEKVVILIDGEMCPDCGKPMSLKTSRWGSQFLGCTGYPECKKTKPLSKDQKPLPDDKPTDEQCEKCQSPMILKYGRFGEYLKCSSEDCGATQALVVKTGVACPKCGEGEVVQKKSRRGKIFYGCNRYPKCDQAFWNKPLAEKCPQCNNSLLVEKALKKGTFHACPEKDCGYIKEVEPVSEAV